MIVDVDTAQRTLAAGDWAVRCAIGRGGARSAADKREGDGATPLGQWPVRGALLRPDRGLEPPRSLPWRWIRPADGWSDDPLSRHYNRPVRHPTDRSAEHLYRDDGIYDAVVVLGYNDRPPVAGVGSAIFLHLMGPGDTEGCVAVDRGTMARLLETLRSNSVIRIS